MRRDFTAAAKSYRCALSTSCAAAQLTALQECQTEQGYLRQYSRRYPLSEIVLGLTAGTSLRRVSLMRGMKSPCRHIYFMAICAAKRQNGDRYEADEHSGMG